jgi:hypothetical protein
MFDSQSPLINTDQPFSTFTNPDVPCSTRTQRSGHFPGFFYSLFHAALRIAWLRAQLLYTFFIYTFLRCVYMSIVKEQVRGGFGWVGVLKGLMDGL